MAAISKRSQARNEKALQELIRSVPGNDTCADCGAKNPGWASWSLGIFLCMRCASLHRKLGTHISKVKSLSMDSWSNEQVDSMRRNGNLKTNRTYNPQNSKPPIPLDVDEVDAVLERFIRQKYDQQSFTSGSSRSVQKSDTGSTRSSDEPPPLPPKPSRRFGFGLRSASSALPLHFNGSSTPPRSPPTSNGWQDEPIRVNKQSRVFGATVGGNNDNMETKLAQLRDMGFTDEKRNINVLKGLGGNVERTIEQLVRLGEGSAPTSRSRTPNPAKNAPSSYSTTSNNPSVPTPNGISFSDKTNPKQAETISTSSPVNDSSAQLQQEPTSRSLSPSNPFNPQTLTNGVHAASVSGPSGIASLDSAFSNMQLANQQPQQPLFPNATGGYPNQTQHEQNARLQTMTPPVPQVQHSPFQTQNPFFQNQQQPSFAPSNPYTQNMQQVQGASSYNPFMPSIPASIQQVNTSTDSPQSYSPQQGLFQPNPQSQYNGHNPGLFAPQHSSTHPPAQATQQYWNPFQQQQQQLLPQQTGRLDKTSILALYNYPQPAPQALNTTEPTSNTDQAPEVGQGTAQQRAPQRSVTMPVQPVAGSKNPFQASLSQPPITSATQQPPTSIGRHVSQESVDIGGFQNGRHSPDAFASLSARYVR